MSVARTPKQNQILAALPRSIYERLLPDLELVAMPLGDVVYEAGTELNHVHFPTTCIVSLLQIMPDGACAQIAAVGSEGLVGLVLLLGDDTTLHHAVVHSGGDGFRIRVAPLRLELDRAGSLLDLMFRHSQALIMQMVQTDMCYRQHSLEQQFCRWLLSSLDRLTSTELATTLQMAASMLGVGLEGMVTLALRLQSERLIVYSHGCIQVIDRPGIEAHACKCYAIEKKEAMRLLFNPIPG